MPSIDAGFCSGSSENGDDMLMDQQPHSPTAASEDSVEVKVTPISVPKNKRKSTEPLRLVSDIDLGPIKKRIRYDETYRTCESVKSEDNQSSDVMKNHFRPWAPNTDLQSDDETSQNIPNPAEVFLRHPGVTTLHRPPPDTSPIHFEQDQPLALVLKKLVNQNSINHNQQNHHHHQSSPSTSSSVYQVSPPLNTESPETISSSMLQMQQIQNLPLNVSCSSALPSSSTSSQTSTSGGGGSGGGQCGQSHSQQQRNYKNMTRERRIEANARERTRVHTISAAFDTLRKSIPAYSNAQKLSKLSVLRISCSYILLLSRIAGMDYSEDQSEPPISECMDLLTKTIQTEGKLRKKKDGE